MMKATKNLLCLLGLFAGCAVFTACSDDDNNNEPSGVPSHIAENLKSVFTGGMPKSAGDVKSISYNNDGLVSSMSTIDGEVKFEYSKVSSKATDKTPKVRMTITHGKGEYCQFVMHLGSNGFVKEAEQIEKDLDETETNQWTFKYNADGQLSYLKKSEGSKEVFISYKDGDIANVEQTTADNDNWKTNILYTSPSVSSPIVNKGCIMMFDEAFEIDLDDIEYAYYAGILGKPTQHLPMGASDNKDTSYYKWTFDSNGYPAFANIDGDGYRFSW